MVLLLHQLNPSADTVKGGKVAQMDHMDPSVVVAEIFHPTEPGDSEDLKPQVKEVLRGRGRS